MKYLSSTIIFVHSFTLKITSARLNKGPVVSLVEKIRARATKRANTVYQICLCILRFLVLV